MDISLAVTVFKRTEKLSQLFDSIDPDVISEVHVADDGKTEEREHLYNQSYDFDLYIHKLPYDSGVGKARAKLSKEVSKEFILCVDCDHEVPSNVDVLYDQLVADQSLGAVAGNVIEPEERKLWQSGKHFYEDGSVIRREVRNDDVEIEFISGYPLIRFDFIPQAMLVRRSCLDDYSWDSNYKNSKEHFDFFLGHWKETDWDFGICPSVTFPHYPGGPANYMSERKNQEKQNVSLDYFLEKWGYTDLKSYRSYWVNSRCPHTPEGYVRDKYEKDPPMKFVKKGVRKAIDIGTGLF